MSTPRKHANPGKKKTPPSPTGKRPSRQETKPKSVEGFFAMFGKRKRKKKTSDLTSPESSTGEKRIKSPSATSRKEKKRSAFGKFWHRMLNRGKKRSTSRDSKSNRKPKRTSKTKRRGRGGKRSRKSGKRSASGSGSSSSTENKVRRAIEKVAKDIRLKKGEQKKMTSVLAIILSSRCKERPAHHPRIRLPGSPTSSISASAVEKATYSEKSEPVIADKPEPAQERPSASSPTPLEPTSPPAFIRVESAKSLPSKSTQRLSPRITVPVSQAGSKIESRQTKSIRRRAPLNGRLAELKAASTKSDYDRKSAASTTVYLNGSMQVSLSEMVTSSSISQTASKTASEDEKFSRTVSPLGQLAESKQSDSERPKNAWPLEAYGSQPVSITLDNAEAKAIQQRSEVVGIVENVLEEVSVKEPELVRPPKKELKDMTVEELIEFRKRHPNKWDRYCQKNTIVSFAMAKAGPDDKKEAKKKQRTSKPKRLQFDNVVEVTEVPVGEDFDPEEEMKQRKGVLKKSPR